jgi:phage host-nuclease inhibitor protein Gam
MSATATARDETTTRFLQGQVSALLEQQRAQDGHFKARLHKAEHQAEESRKKLVDLQLRAQQREQEQAADATRLQSELRVTRIDYEELVALLRQENDCLLQQLQDQGATERQRLTELEHDYRVTLTTARRSATQEPPRIPKVILKGHTVKSQSSEF